MIQDDTKEEAGCSPPLTGYRILELGHYIAGPFASRLLADMGAEVIKVESLKGDPVRDWGEKLDGQSLWWSVHGRNKKSVTLNLKAPEATEIIGKLVSQCDAVIENFRAGQLARLGFSDDFFRSHNPNIVIGHISGYGQTGPLAQQACFGVIGEALGGLRFLTNHKNAKDQTPPIRCGISIGDSVAGLYAALGVVAELAARKPRSTRVVDVALTEAVLSLLEGTLPEYGAMGKIRQPSGGRIPTAAPSNVFPTKDERWIIIAANSNSLFQSLCDLMGREDLGADPRYRENSLRVANVDELEPEIEAWTCSLEASELESLLAKANIPSCKVFDASDIVRDAQFNARKMILDVKDEILGNVLHPAPVPSFENVRREVERTGPSIGQDNDAVYGGLLKVSNSQLEEWRSAGVV